MDIEFTCAVCGCTIHMCERIGPGFAFGDIDSGLDEEAMVELINRFVASRPDCGDCWARSFCPICIAAAGEQGEFRFEERCTEVRSNLASNFSFLYSILERRPDAFCPPELAQEEWRQPTLAGVPS